MIKASSKLNAESDKNGMVINPPYSMYLVEQGMPERQGAADSGMIPHMRRL